MASGGRQQVHVLNTAIRKQVGRFKAQGPEPYLKAFASLASDGVCARCLLRLAGHTGFEDYALPAPSQSQILAALCPERSSAAAVVDPSGSTTAANGTAPTTGASTSGTVAESRCPICFGLLQTLLEEPPRRLLTAAGMDPACHSGRQGQPQDGSQQQRQADTVLRPVTSNASAAAVGAAGAAGVDVAWLRIQHRALPGAAGCRTGPASGHERLPGLPSAAGLAEAVRRQAEEGPPDTAALAAAAAVPAAPALSGPEGATEHGAGDDGTRDATMTEAADAATTTRAVESSCTEAAAAGQEGVAAPVTASTMASAALVPTAHAPEDLGPKLPMRSFSLEVAAVPAACAIHDVVAYAQLAALYDNAGAPYSGWRATDVVPLVNVLRRTMPLVLSRLLGVPSAAPQAADVAVSVAAVDGEAGLAEVQVLLEDQAAHQARRYHQQHPQRHGKRQRGNPQGGRGSGGGGGAAAADGGAPGEEGPAAPRPREVSEERLRSMTAEQAGAAAAGMPRPVLQRLFPWPPLLRTRVGSAAAGGGTLAEQQPQPEQEPQAEEMEGEQQVPPPEGEKEEQQPQQATLGEAAALQEGGAPVSGSVGGGESAAAVAEEGEESLWPGVHVRVVHAPLLLAGRYCKLRRHMPQCPWFVLSTGARIGGTSVQEAIEAFVLPLYGTCTAKMVTGGREDADVRMLGAGRPFVLEVQAPLRGHPPAEVLRRLEQRMLESKCGVSVQCLVPCGPAALDAIKAAEDSKEKSYRALCWAARPVGPEELAGLRALGRVEAAQDTPVRVLHRRAAKVRPKWLQIEAATPVPGQPHYFVLTLRTQAGTYVKEFCHGDFGRCTPNLGQILAQVRGKGAAAGGGADGAACGGASGGPDAGGVDGGGRGVAGGAGVSGGGSGGNGDGGGVGGGSGGYEHVEIVQLDVLDVHLEDWP